jgi:dipeptidyl aminopeptidase/acylaminoacyl peptidase
MERVVAHGHSMGAFVTALLVASASSAFRAASHTAGGTVPDGIDAFAPTDSEVSGIRASYQMHHGDADFVVPLLNDLRLDDLLARRGVIHQLFIYPGAGHDDVSRSTVVLDRVRVWYTEHGVLR